AMLATMGVAASTANAYPLVNDDDVHGTYAFRVALYTADAPYKAFNYSGAQYKYGDTFDLRSVADPYSSVEPYNSATDGKILTGYTYDLAGTRPAKDLIAVKGDTNLYAQYAKAYTVTFDTNANGKADSSDKKIEVKAGSPIDAAAYAKSGAEAAAETAKVSGDVFAGWKQSKADDVDDLFTNQAVNSNLTLYPVYERYSAPEDEQNVSVVDFHENGTTNTQRFYTLANKAFPEFRAPQGLKQDQWQAPLGTAYDFNATVANGNEDYGKADLTVNGVKFSSSNAWTVKYDFDGANATLDNGTTTAHGTTAYQYVAEGTQAPQPSDPAKKNAQFTGWFSGTTKVDFSKNVEDLPGADASTRTVTVKAGWDTENIVPVVFYFGYNRTEPVHPWDNFTFPVTTADANGKVLSKTGKAIDYVTAGTALTAPANLEQHFQTAANVAHGDWTDQSVTAWLAVNDDAPIASVPAGAAGIEVYAKWSSALAVKLNANGGTFKNNTGYAYATIADGQQLQNVVETPTRDGYNFINWVSSVDKSLHANLSDNHWYDATGAQRAPIKDGDELVAQWQQSGSQSVDAALTAYPLVSALPTDEFGVTVPSFKNKTADYALFDKYGFTEASWKAYVDTVYTLKDDYEAYRDAKGQAKKDAAEKLAAKLQAAQKSLVKSDSAVVPAGR
ncbi:InlB B-repeat-containing protein, partial [Bifidobacterium callitrichos]